MKTKTTLKTLAVFALLGSMSLGVTAQTVDKEEIIQIETKYYGKPDIVPLPPPPPPPPPLDDDEDYLKMNEENLALDHFPYPGGAPIPIYEENYASVNKSDDFDLFDIYEPIKTSVGESKMDLADIRIFPNPTTDYVNVDLTSRPGLSLKLVDSSGRIVLEQRVDGDQVHRIDLGNYSDGVYMLVFESESLRESRAVVIRG